MAAAAAGRVRVAERLGVAESVGAGLEVAVEVGEAIGRVTVAVGSGGVDVGVREAAGEMSSCVVGATEGVRAGLSVRVGVPLRVARGDRVGVAGARVRVIVRVGEGRLV